MWFLIVVGFLAVYWIWTKQRNSSGGLPPKPKGYFFIGNGTQIDPANPLKKFEEWKKEFGDVYMFKLPGINFVVVNGEEAIREVLITKTADFAGRPASIYETGTTGNNTSIAISSDTERWKVIKRSLLVGLKMYGNSLFILETVALESITELVNKFKSYQGKAFDPSVDCMQVISDIMLQLVTGKSPPASFLKEFMVITDAINHITSVRGFSVALFYMPWLRHFGHPHWKILNQFREYREKTIGYMIEERKAQFDINEPTCLIDALLKERLTKKNKHGEPIISEMDMIMIVSDAIIAGLVTTQRVLYCFIAIMTHHMDVQRKLQKEADDVIKDGMPRLADKPEMPYTRAVLFEILRFISHFPLMLTHRATKDSTIGGYTIPKDFMICTNSYGLHHDERYWDEPWEFKPERYLDENGQLVTADHPNRRRLMAFGAGKRVCSGDVLSKNRLFLIFASLMLNFNFVAVKGDEPKIDPRGYRPGILLTMPAYKVIVESRQK